MKLYVMRHGPAEDESISGRDEDRALTAKGRTRVRDVARCLADKGETPRVILSSPLVRAMQTAEIVAAELELNDKGGSVLARRELEPGGDALELAFELAAKNDHDVMVVGHEPDLSSLVRRLAGRAVPITMDKAAVVGFELTHGVSESGKKGAKVRLRFALDPKSLKWNLDVRDDGK